MLIVAIGNPLVSPVVFYGPFDNFIHVNQWVSVNHPNEQITIIPVVNIV